MFADFGLLEVSAVLVAAFFGLLAGGLWIGLSLIVVGMLAMAITSNAPIGAVLVTTTWGKINSWTLAALPLFVLMGEIMFRAGLSERMYKGLSPWMGRFPGGLLHANVLGSGVFAAVSGSSAASCAAMGRIALPELKRRGYSDGISVGSLAGASTLGLLIPPSIPMIIYAIAANVSVIQMFLAGILPGLLVLALFSIYIVGWSLLNPSKLPPADEHVGLYERLYQTLNLLPPLLLIVGIVLSMMFGWATATETAALGVLGALLIAAWSRTLNGRMIRESLLATTRLSTMIMLLILGAAFTTTAMAYTGIPQALANWVSAMELNAFTLIAVLTVMYLMLGCFLDGISMIVLTTVVVLPMIQAAGFDLIWFGIYLIILIEVAQITPPVGFNLFVLQSITGRESLFIARDAIPFWLLLLATVGLLVVFPEIALYLPSIAKH